MSRIAYVNGQYLPHDRAGVHIEDRGYQFADGVYEVIAVQQGKLIDLAAHLDRLNRSLSALRLPWPTQSRAVLEIILRRVIRLNRVKNGIVYLQVTRGSAPRNHAFPKLTIPSLVVTSRSTKPFSLDTVINGVKAITLPDERWKRCDIKSVSLLPNILGKQLAVEQGAYEAILVDVDGRVTEGTSSNAWIVTEAGTLVTRNLSQAILAGITRHAVLEVARAHGVPVEERVFELSEMQKAREVFVTSTTSFVKPVVQLDNALIGEGAPGALSKALLSWYADHMGAM
ncbi:MAG: D-amino-acid transaminase [Magnetospiraceae bacterium]